MKKFFVTLLVMLSTMVTASCFAGAFGAFNGNAGAPRVVIGEVSCYGEQALKPQFFLTFKDLLTEQLQNTSKLAVEDIYFTPAAANVISEVHMNAIVHSKQFVREQANITLVRYYRNLDHEPEVSGDVYRLEPDIRLQLNNIDELSGADYVLFCNLKNVEVEEKHHNDAALPWEAVQGTKVKVDVDYYLVDKKSGIVYAGTSSVDKTAQVFDVMVMKYGKQLTPEQLLQNVLEKQAKRIVDDITNKGMKKMK